MKCSCGRQAIVQRGDDSGTLALCVDCNLKFEQALTLEFDRSARAYNRVAAQLEATTAAPIRIPRISEGRPHFVKTGDVTLNNIKVDHSTIGVLNTGYIETLDGAVTVLRSRGSGDAAAAIAELTEAVAANTESETQLKDQVLELLSVLSTEITAPKEKRRAFAMRPLITELSTLLGDVASLTALWDRCRSFIEPLLS